MSNHKNVIEINGKKYDAKSGMLLSDVLPSVPIPQHTVQVHSPQPTEPAAMAVKQNRAPVTQPNPHRARHPQRSQTLMRRAVNRPVSDITPAKPTVTRFAANNARQDRAQATAKSPFINKYGQVSTPIKKMTSPLQVQTPPDYQARPTQHQPASEPALAAPLPPQQTQSEILFNNALEKVSLTQQEPQSSNRKFFGVLRLGFGLTAAVLVIGAVAYMNLPKINLKLASAQAGFSAILPTNQPAGYHLANPIDRAAGKITLNFKSNTDERNYQLNQEISNWNSESLQENFFVAHNKPFRIVQDGGKTIFLYDNGNATWVNGGVWYTITSKDLSSDQIINLTHSF